MVLMRDFWKFQFLQPRGCLSNPFRTLSLCFGVIGKTAGLISRNNFLLKIFVYVGHRDNILARYDSVFPLLRCRRVWNKPCTQLSLSQILFQSTPLHYTVLKYTSLHFTALYPTTLHSTSLHLSYVCGG